MIQGRSASSIARLAAPVAACFFLISCSSSDEPAVTGGNDPGIVFPTGTDDGATTAGQTTVGLTTAGQTTAGQTTAGQTTAGQTTAGQTTAGQTTAGQTTAGGGEQLPEPEACSVRDINRWAHATMKTSYLYTAQMPEVNPDGFFTTKRLVERLTVSGDKFTSIFDARGSAGNPTPRGFRFGYGIDRVEQTADALPQIRILAFNSPARAAGIKRGDVVISLNGTPGAELVANNWALWDQYLFTDDATRIPEFVIRTGNEQPRTLKLQRAQYSQNMLDSSRYFYTVGSSPRKVALLTVEFFYLDSEAALDSYAQWFKQTAAADLILDLRYTRGGFVNQTQKLVSQIAGNGAAGRPYLLYDYNDNFDDEVVFLTEQLNSLDLQRVIVLTTGRTSSVASHMLSGLGKIVEVITVGEPTEALESAELTQTYDYCGKTLRLVTINQLGPDRESLLAPIQPTCPVQDSWDVPATDSTDPLLNAGILYALNSNCPTVPVTLQVDQSFDRGPDSYARNSTPGKPVRGN